MYFPKRTMERATQVARTMLQSGVQVAPLPSPANERIIIAYVATDEKLIHSLVEFEVEGKTFYLGNQKEGAEI